MVRPKARQMAPQKRLPLPKELFGMQHGNHDISLAQQSCLRSLLHLRENYCAGGSSCVLEAQRAKISNGQSVDEDQPRQHR